MLTEKQKIAKQHLKQLYHLNEMINADLDEIESLRAMSTNIASFDLTKERVSSTPSHDAHFVKAVDKLTDLEETVAKHADEYIQLYSEIREMIKLIDNPDYVLVLKHRYLLFHTWEQTAKEMGITTQWVHKLKERALEYFADILTSKEKAA